MTTYDDYKARIAADEMCGSSLSETRNDDEEVGRVINKLEADIDSVIDWAAIDPCTALGRKVLSSLIARALIMKGWIDPEAP